MAGNSGGSSNNKKQKLALSEEATASLAEITGVLKCLTLLPTNSYRMARMHAVPLLVSARASG